MARVRIGYMGEMFQVSAERERIKTCLADLGETAAAFRQMTQQGLEKLADAMQPRLKARWLLLTPPPVPQGQSSSLSIYPRDEVHIPTEIPGERFALYGPRQFWTLITCFV